MKFKSLMQCVRFLEAEKDLVTIDTPVDPHLEMAEITKRVYAAGGPALLFTHVRGSKFPCVSNLMGAWTRVEKIFEPQLSQVKALVDLASDPKTGMKHPGKAVRALPALAHALPLKSGKGPAAQSRCRISDLPMIQCWPKDGGAFILLPQVFSMEPGNDSILASNLGMYRVQISGNDYIRDREIGLHYQLHRGIGNHHKTAIEKNLPLKVSVFIGGPPAHTLAAVMPLPEGMPEIAFAGALAGRNFRYAKKNGHVISLDADFCITGTIVPGETKIEGPFGDHLGYYSLAHPYPFMKVERVYHRRDAVYPFTVVGRPPQEDTNFGRLIHEITRSAVRDSIPGVIAVNAVDDAGVHPLLLAKAHERYVPYEPRKPRELLTHAARILGTGQLSLAKYLMICAHEDRPDLDVNDPGEFFQHFLERIDLQNDLHFLTRTTMDTLDYSTSRINDGSKLIMAAAGPKRRTLSTVLPGDFYLPEGFACPKLAAPGILIVQGPCFSEYQSAAEQMNRLKKGLAACREACTGFPLILVVDDAVFAAASFSNFLWVGFSRTNPSHDIYGLNETIVFKHWGCDPSLILDARKKPFHADPLEPDPNTVEAVNRLGLKGRPLHGII